MLFLYMDNYRGFSDTYLPIKDVNFLVGENSTGKTSVLALLQVLCSPQFWFGQEFNNKEVELGTFKDIVSVRAEKKTNFRVGLLECSDERVQAFLLTFREEQGLPEASRYDYYIEGKEVNTAITKRGISYRVNPVELKGNMKEKLLLSMFRKWVSQKRSGRGFKLVKEKLPFGRKGSLLFIPSLVEGKDVGKKRRPKVSFRLNIPMLFEGFAWLAPIRSKPRRTYDEFRTDFTSEGEHTPYLIRNLLRQSKLSKKFKNFMSHFGKESDLFDSVLIRNFGKQATSPFSLNILLQGKTLNMKNVGYGVSQSLPVIVELFARPRDTWFAIQQPEIHLHPKAQAALGDIIFSLATKEKKKFLIETHSDYTIDRFMLKYKKRKSKIHSQVLFFESTRSKNKIHTIEIDKNGEYSEKQPKGFREFFIKEELNLLGIK